MRITYILMAVLITTLGVSAMNAVARDEVYRWVDEDGVVHFSALPGEHADAVPVKIRKSMSVSSQPSSTPAPEGTSPLEEPQPSYAQQQRDERAKHRKEAAEKQRDIAAGCEQRRQIVARLEPSTRVMVRLEDGSVTRMDDNERLETLAEAKDYIAGKCDN